MTVQLPRPMLVRAPVADSPSSGFLTAGYIALLLVALYYYVYRYPLQINSSTTSPTYADTPLLLQAGKYVALGIILTVIAVRTIGAEGQRQPIAPSHAVLGIVFLTVGALAIAKGALLGDFSAASRGMVVLPGVILLAAGLRWTVSLGRLGRVVSWFAVIVLVVEALQVALFYAIGRLPALAYEGSTSVRFGSILDDPNGLGMLMPLLVPVIWIAWRDHKFWRLVGSAGLITTLILTQSFTAISVFFVVIAAGSMMLASRSGARVVGIAAVSGGVAFVALQIALTNPVIASVITSKSGSIAARQSQISSNQLGFADLIGMGSGSRFVESSYIGMVAAVGLVPTIAYFGVGMVAAVRAAQRIRSGERQPLLFGIYFFLIAYLVGAVNLRMDDIFPANFIYILAVCLSVSVPQEPTLKAQAAGGRRGSSSMQSP